MAMKMLYSVYDPQIGESKQFLRPVKQSFR